MSAVDTVPIFDLGLDTSDLKESECREGFTNEHLVAIHVQDFPALCDRGNSIARRLLYCECFLDEAITFLEEARSAYKRVLTWTRESAVWQPLRSLQLPKDISGDKSRYPKRADTYANVVQASDCNYMRISWAVLLSVMAKVRRNLEPLLDPMESCTTIQSAKVYEDELQDLVDDVCASVPFYMSPNHRLDLDDPAQILTFYPHAADDLRLPVGIAPSVIRSMCHLMGPLIQVSILESIPESQREWAKSYRFLIARHAAHQQRSASSSTRTLIDVSN